VYINPVLLPQVSNREDFLLTVSIFDDDTGNPADLSGRTLATAGNFTAAKWTVIDGPIVTTSTSSLTIPDFPIGSSVVTLSLTVGTGLGIIGGDFITIADLTGLNTMSGYVATYSPTTGALVCQIGMAFEFEIRTLDPRRHGGNGFSTFGDVGVVSQSAPRIAAQLGNGITIVDIGVIQILIPAAQLQILRSKTYMASLTMSDGINTRQPFIGRLPVLYGGVHRTAATIAPGGKRFVPPPTPPRQAPGFAVIQPHATIIHYGSGN
jgi:hypothetical protein